MVKALLSKQNMVRHTHALQEFLKSEGCETKRDCREKIRALLYDGADPTGFIEDLSSTSSQLIFRALKRSPQEINDLVLTVINQGFEKIEVEQTLLHQVASWGNVKLFQAIISLGGDWLKSDSLNRYPHSLLLADSVGDLQNPQFTEMNIAKLASWGDHYLTAATIIESSQGEYDQPAIFDLIYQVKLFRRCYYLARNIEMFVQNNRELLRENKITFDVNDSENFRALSFVDSVKVIIGKIDWEDFIESHAPQNHMFKKPSYQKLECFFMTIRAEVESYQFTSDCVVEELA